MRVRRVRASSPRWVAAILVALAATLAGACSSSPAPSIATQTASPTQTATASPAATVGATASPSAAPSPVATPTARAAIAGTAAEQNVRAYATASGLHVRGVAEVPTAGTDESGHALVAVLTDDAIQMFQVSDISVLPVGAPAALADLSFTPDAIAAWPDAAWPGAVWLKASGQNASSTSIGMLSWDRAHGWREQLAWAEYAACTVGPVLISDLNGDAVPEVSLTGVAQASGAIPLCSPGTPRLYRWTGGRMTEVQLTTVPAGAPGAADNNRAVAEAQAGDWSAADTTIQAAAPLAAGDASIFWNMALIAMRSIYRTVEEGVTHDAVAAAATGDFAAAFARAHESSVPIGEVITPVQAKAILAHATPGEPDASTPDAALAALAELTFRVAAREALAGTPDAGDPAALAADQSALAAARTAVFGTP